MVSKNGNFLLDVGPKADGTIVQEEQDNLRAAGKWINAHAEAIFNTTYWFTTPEDSTGDIRFTQTGDAFYILSLKQPVNETLLVDAPIPIMPGDVVTAVGIQSNTSLTWRKSETGILEIQVPQNITSAEEYCWVFKVDYRA
ncbi:putative alpha-L-fucosidase, partial [Aureobasidium melanogenum]